MSIISCELQSNKRVSISFIHRCVNLVGWLIFFTALSKIGWHDVHGFRCVHGNFVIAKRILNAY